MNYIELTKGAVPVVLNQIFAAKGKELPAKHSGFCPVRPLGSLYHRRQRCDPFPPKVWKLKPLTDLSYIEFNYYL